MAAGAQARRGALPRAGPLQLVPRSSLLLAVLCCTVLPVLETRSSAPPDLPRSYSAFGGLASLASVRTPHAGFSRALREKAATVLSAALLQAERQSASGAHANKCISTCLPARVNESDRK